MIETDTQILPDWLIPHAPNHLQLVDLEWVVPNVDNIRLFIERDSLETLTDRYTAYRENPAHTVLPDPPVVRFHSYYKPLELLGGHRRIEAALVAGLEQLPVRVVFLDDMEAYKFIIQANQSEPISTVEMAYKIAEMDRLNFSRDEIKQVFGNIQPGRYITVGSLLHPNMFTDIEKKCDPSITTWFEAAKLGADHFIHCFRHWDAGLWGEEECNRFFRTSKGRAMPLESYQRGLRLTLDGDVLRIRGTLNLGLHSAKELDEISQAFTKDFLSAVGLGRAFGSFGKRKVTLYEPLDRDG